MIAGNIRRTEGYINGARVSVTETVIGNAYVLTANGIKPVEIIQAAIEIYGRRIVIIGIQPANEGSGVSVPDHTSVIGEPDQEMPQDTTEVTKAPVTSSGGVAVIFEGASPSDKLKQNAKNIVAGLPKDQRDCVDQVAFVPKDGSKGVMGWYNPGVPKEKGRVNVDIADSSYENLRKTIPHEAFHAFTVQKLLPAFEDFLENGTSDSKCYGENMNSLWEKYIAALKSGDKKNFPTDYAASFLDAFQSGVRKAENYVRTHKATPEQARAFINRVVAIGFMEYLAELGSEYEVNGRPSYCSTQLGDAYAAIANIVNAAA